MKTGTVFAEWDAVSRVLRKADEAANMIYVQAKERRGETVFEMGLDFKDWDDGMPWTCRPVRLQFSDVKRISLVRAARCAGEGNSAAARKSLRTAI